MKIKIRVTKTYSVPVFEMFRGSTPEEPLFPSEPTRTEQRETVLFSGGENAFEIWKRSQGHFLDEKGVEMSKKVDRGS